MIDILFYYVFYSSAVLFYGIGFRRAAALSASFDKSVFRPALRCGFAALASTFLTALITEKLFSPLGIAELFPLPALFILAAVAAGTGIFLPGKAILQTKEFAVSYLIVLLALFESSRLFDAVFTAASCMLSFVFVIPVLSAVRYRIDIARSKNEKAARGILIMIVSAILIIACSAWNVSWLNDYFMR